VGSGRFLRGGEPLFRVVTAARLDAVASGRSERSLNNIFSLDDTRFGGSG